MRRSVELVCLPTTDSIAPFEMHSGVTNEVPVRRVWAEDPIHWGTRCTFHNLHWRLWDSNRFTRAASASRSCWFWTR